MTPGPWNLSWKRDRFTHRAVDSTGSRWHITASSSHHWSVYRDSIEQEHLWGYTLADAKGHVEYELRLELDSEFATRVAERRAARCQRKENP